MGHPLIWTQKSGESHLDRNLIPLLRPKFPQMVTKQPLSTRSTRQHKLQAIAWKGLCPEKQLPETAIDGQSKRTTRTRHIESKFGHPNSIKLIPTHKFGQCLVPTAVLTMSYVLRPGVFFIPNFSWPSMHKSSGQGFRIGGFKIHGGFFFFFYVC